MGKSVWINCYEDDVIEVETSDNEYDKDEKQPVNQFEA